MPFLIPLIALAAGILAGSMAEGPAWGLIPIAAGLVYYLFLIKKTALPMQAIRLNKRHSVWIFLLFAGIGMFDSWFNRPYVIPENLLSEPIAAEGVIDDATPSADGDRFTVSVSRLADSSGHKTDCRNLRIILKTDGLSASAGDVIVFPARFERITDNPNYRPSGYASRMERNGILYRTFADCDDVKTRGRGSGLAASASSWRDRLVSVVEKSSLSRPTAGFIVALLFGDRSFITPEVKESFSDAGVAHVLALSGMHVAIIMGIILVILFPMKLAGLHRLRYMTALLILWAYAFFSGMAPSTVRACIMTTFVIAALSIQRKNASANALLASAFIILLFNPYALFDVGMQLSFLCVGCILAFAGPLNPVNRHMHPKTYAVCSAVIVSLTATLGTWVLVSYYFKKIPLLFLPANLFILPLLPVYLGVALLYVGCLLSGHDPLLLVWTLDKGYDLFLHVAGAVSGFGEAVIDYKVQFPVVILWLLGILILGMAMRRKKRKTAVATALSVFALSLILIPVLRNPAPDGLIFRNDYTSIAVTLYDSDVENVAKLPRNTVSRIMHKGCEVFSLDCMSGLDSLSKAVGSTRRGKKKYLILGSGFKWKNIDDIPFKDTFDKIIIHSSVRKNIENRLLDSLDVATRERIYSIRRDGPLEIRL